METAAIISIGGTRVPIISIGGAAKFLALPVFDTSRLQD